MTIFVIFFAFQVRSPKKYPCHSELKFNHGARPQAISFGANSAQASISRRRWWARLGQPALCWIKPHAVPASGRRRARPAVRGPDGHTAGDRLVLVDHRSWGQRATTGSGPTDGRRPFEEAKVQFAASWEAFKAAQGGCLGLPQLLITN